MIATIIGGVDREHLVLIVAARDRCPETSRVEQAQGAHPKERLMVLLDTSVWVRALHGKQPFQTHLDQLLADEMALGHELVYGELLIGDRGARAKLLSTYVLLTHAKTIPHREVVSMVQARRLFGRGIGWMDIHLLASAIAARAQLYSADGPLMAIADELGVAFSA